jgi:hypothetical protein
VLSLLSQVASHPSHLFPPYPGVWLLKLAPETRTASGASCGLGASPTFRRYLSSATACGLAISRYTSQGRSDVSPGTGRLRQRLRRGAPSQWCFLVARTVWLRPRRTIGARHIGTSGSAIRLPFVSAVSADNRSVRSDRRPGPAGRRRCPSRRRSRRQGPSAGPVRSSPLARTFQ